MLEETLRAVAHPDGRIEVPSEHRKVMRAIATPLELGIQHEAPFVLGLKWKDHFDRAIAAAQQQGQSEITVGDLRRWFDVPDPLGLPRDLQSLVILVYAAQSGRVFRQHGGPAEPTLEKLEDDLELVSPELPAQGAWDIARARAASVLGIADVNPALRSFETLVASLRARGQALLPSIEALLPIMEQRSADLGVDLNSSSRVKSARIAHDVAQGLVGPDNSIGVIERLAAVDIPSEPHVGTALASADAVRATLSDERWTLLKVAIERASASEVGFVEVVASLRTALATDEFAARLEPAVAKAYADAVKLSGPAAPPAPSHRRNNHRRQVSRSSEARGPALTLTKPGASSTS